MKTYLVTGCAGFIGSNFVHYMLEKYEDIRLVNLDKLTYAGTQGLSEFVSNTDTFDPKSIVDGDWGER